MQTIVERLASVVGGTFSQLPANLTKSCGCFVTMRGCCCIFRVSNAQQHRMSSLCENLLCVITSGTPKVLSTAVHCFMNGILCPFVDVCRASMVWLLLNALCSPFLVYPTLARGVTPLQQHLSHYHRLCPETGRRCKWHAYVVRLCCPCCRCSSRWVTSRLPACPAECVF